MKRLVTLFIGALAAMLISACSNDPARNVNSSVPSILTASQVETAIIDAGRSQLWDMKKVRDGLIVGKLVTSDNSAEIRIPYTATKYAIEYVGSQNLTPSADKVPGSYNKWIQKLDEDIQLRLGGEQ